MTEGARPTSTVSKPTSKRPKLQLRDIVLMVTLGVAFGFLYWALVQAWNGLAVAMGPAGDLAQHVVFGGWLLVAPIAVAIIRRPFVGIIAEVIASVVEVIFLGSPVGPLLLVAALLQGAGSELPFALTRYRRFSWPIYALSGVLGAVFVFGFSAVRAGWFGQDILLMRFGMQVASGLVLGGLLAKLIVDALVRTGVLDEFAIGRELGRAGRGRRESVRGRGEADAPGRDGARVASGAPDAVGGSGAPDAVGGWGDRDAVGGGVVEGRAAGDVDGAGDVDARVTDDR
ncbi:MAG: ECF transporter S component [Pseudoclavibacter sp.]